MKRHVVMPSQYGERVRADFVRRVAVGRDAIRTHDDAVDLAPGEEPSDRAVGHHTMRNTVLPQLPRRQSRALQQRPCLGHDHAAEPTSCVH